MRVTSVWKATYTACFKDQLTECANFKIWYTLRPTVETGRMIERSPGNRKRGNGKWQRERTDGNGEWKCGSFRVPVFVLHSPFPVLHCSFFALVTFRPF